MSNFAKDVAKELEKRSRRRKLTGLAVVGALVALAISYLQCGSGFGLGGGKGKGEGEGISSVKAPEPVRCTVRVSAEGIFVDGNKTTRDEAVKLCKKTEGAMVTVTGDARQGDWDELRAALEAVGVKIYLRGQLWDGSSAPPPQP